MSQPNEKNKNTGSLIINIGVTLASQIGIVVIGVVLIAVFVGIWIDKTFSTKPIFTILFLLGSGPVSLYLVYRLATRAVANISSLNNNPVGDEGTIKEDLKSE